jgi:prepilin signal peptidase PulO-like enzyme (type II secretory pathway)
VNGPLAIAGVTVAGGLVGLGSGWLAVALEKFEKLEAEERQERLDYERDIAEERSSAAAAGEEPEAARPWSGERYGWTWLERWLSPALGALGFGAFAAHEQFGVGLLIHLLWIAVFVQVVDFDLKHRLILNVITYPSILAALVLSEWSPGLTVTSAIIGAVGVAAFFFVQNLVSRGSIGLGDAKLGALVGAVTGAGPTSAHLGAVYAVIAGVFIGGATALVLLVTRVRGLKDPIPYGPFLCAGAALILYLGP